VQGGAAVGAGGEVRQYYHYVEVINGVMVDMADLPDGGDVDAHDFDIGGDGTPLLAVSVGVT
jgi:hypothetical protein